MLRGNITHGVRDDDTDYTVLGLHIMEEKGVDFTSRDVASQWQEHLPYFLVYTAERVAYRNIVNNIWPPESAAFQNPYREWIGAQIRCDAFGYAAPGWPEKHAKTRCGSPAPSDPSTPTRPQTTKSSRLMRCAGCSASRFRPSPTERST